ncbi:tryptophan-rich sensory protein [Candidatus Saccharibacteria bacterium]|nr:tryptophan-rich sensory protein [Candidatus Saccharibacteria bacterium]
MRHWGKVWRFVLCVVVPLVVGGISAALTMGAMSKFGEMKQPPLAPPAWLFPVAWTILYVLMGVASWFVWMKGMRGGKKEKTFAKKWLFIYGLQLVFNFCWSPMFFNFQWYWFAFGWLIVMWLMIIALIVMARKYSMPAMWMLIPYVLWCTFAAYLNAGIAVLN